MQGTPIHHHRYKGTTSKLLLLINLWAFQKDNFPQFRQNMKMKQDDIFTPGCNIHSSPCARQYEVKEKTIVLEIDYIDMKENLTFKRH